MVKEQQSAPSYSERQSLQQRATTAVQAAAAAGSLRFNLAVWHLQLLRDLESLSRRLNLKEIKLAAYCKSHTLQPL